MSVTIMQTEVTFDVEFEESSYTVTRTEDFNSCYIDYVVFDEEGNEVTGDLEDKILTYLEENSN